MDTTKTNQPVPPEGFTRVTRGVTQLGDIFVLEHEPDKWLPFTQFFGLPVAGYLAVARKLPEQGDGQEAGLRDFAEHARKANAAPSSPATVPLEPAAPVEGGEVDHESPEALKAELQRVYALVHHWAPRAMALEDALREHYEIACGANNWHHETREGRRAAALLQGEKLCR